MVKSEFGRALYMLAQELGTVEEIKLDLTDCIKIFEASPEYAVILDTPAISKAEKLALIDEAFKPMNESIVSLLKILSEKHSVASFKDVFKTYISLYNEGMGIMEVEVVSAIPLSDSQLCALKERLDKITGKACIIKNTVDPSILGGIKLRYEGTQIDASIKTRLDGFASSLRNVII